MKNLFTLFVLVCFSYGIANAQDKAAVKAERVTKLDSKETLKKAQVQPKKVEGKRANVKRIDANNSKRVVLTEEQRKAQPKENAVKAD